MLQKYSKSTLNSNLANKPRALKLRVYHSEEYVSEKTRMVMSHGFNSSETMFIQLFCFYQFIVGQLY
jgi:hypothetical protein